MKTIKAKSKSEDSQGNGGVIAAIILAILALIVAIISAFFYMDMWSSQTASRSYPVTVRPAPLPKTVKEDTNLNTTISNANITNNANTNTELVQLTTPSASSTVTSPIEIAGSAPGNWFFEAVFPITLVDAEGNELARTQAQAVGDWMTTEQVDFTASLEYTTTETITAELVFKPDNPSGLPNSTSYSLPVTLTATE